MRAISRFSTAILLAASLYGQQGGDAIVVGTVVDPTRAAVQSATVTVKHLATGATIQVQTDQRGEYRTPPVRIGEYTISIEAAGFKRFNQTGVVLDIGDVRQVDAVLQLGQVSDSVNVEASAPLLQTADATVGTVIGNQQIEDLPLNGRDYMQLAVLSAGTIPSINSGIGISVGGQQGYAVGFLLDGVDNNNQSIRYSYGNQKEAIKPSIDAIQEFKVVTNTFSAEYGRSSSGVVSVSIKSGTNQIHGTAYDFLRNQVLDAKNLFATSKPPYKRNDFGGSLGAPVIRNKLFIFGDIEYNKIRESTTTVDTVPTVAEREGIFPGTIYDPASYNATTSARAPFAGNQIPLSRINPIAQQVLSWYPLPQTRAATNNYVYQDPGNQNPYRWDIRADQILSDKQNLFFRYSEEWQETDPGSALPPIPTINYFTGGSKSTVDSKGFALGYNRVWTPSLISSFHVAWSYLFNVASSVDKANLNTVIGLQGADESYPGGLASFPITGFTSVGGTGLGNVDGSQTRQVSGDLTWTKGAHTIKIGAQAFWLQTNFFSAQQSDGILNFTGVYTRNPTTGTGGSGLADFLLGDASGGSLSNFEWVNLRQPLPEFFVQDDWKATRRLTLNIGLRYELNYPAVDRLNKMANFDLDTNPSDPSLVLANSRSRTAEALQSMDYHQFAPRFGFAYSLPDDKTVLRGGYGIFYSGVMNPGGMQSLEINAPYHIQVQLSPSPTVPSLGLANGFPAGSLSLANASNVLFVSDDMTPGAPMAQMWNFNVQRELPGGILVEVGYYGNKLDHGLRQFDGNPAPPEPGNTNANRRFTSIAIPGTPYTVSLADVIRIQKDGYSDYNGLQAKVEKRYSKGLTFSAAYSYSKTMALGENFSGGVQNPADWDADRAVSSQDMTQHFVGSAVYTLPFGRGKTWGANWNRWVNGVLGGWSAGPIVTVDTGLPLNLSVNGNPSNTGQGTVVGINDRPNVIGDWHLANPTVREWFNTAAFAPNAPYTFGNAGAYILRGPGLVNLDIAAHKSFRITERISAQLRLESFNATNTPALGAPNAQVGNPLFGQITSAGSARDNQIGLKILF
jgi:hypothetical protein